MSVDLEGLARLREPFSTDDIDKLPKGVDRNGQKASCKECGGYHAPAAIHLDYVGHAAITERLLEVDPTWNWEPMAKDQFGAPVYDRSADGQPIGMWIWLTACGLTRPGYGSCEQGKSDPVKELIGDALRNAGMRFGMALELWRKGKRDTPRAESKPPAGRPSQGPSVGSGTSPRAAGSTSPRSTQPASLHADPAPGGPHAPAKDDSERRTLSQLTVLGRIADPAHLQIADIERLFRERYGHELKDGTKTQVQEFSTWLKGAIGGQRAAV